MPTRSVVIAMGLLACVGGRATSAYAQGFGIGPRVTFVQPVVETEDDDSDRYFGGVLRLGGGKFVLEVAIDYRSETTDDERVRVKNVPIQTSVLFFPFKTSIAPYLLGGAGWYSTTIERLVVGGDETLADETTRRFGWHAGLGGELRLTRSIAVFGDYRYTFLQFGDDDDIGETPGLIPLAGQFNLSHEGSMWAWGAVFYF